MTDTPHLCHAVGCPHAVAPRLLMCRRHWRLVPKALQMAVWAEYRPGQEQDKRPSRAFLKVALAAVEAVAAAEQQRAARAKRARRQTSFLGYDPVAAGLGVTPDWEAQEAMEAQIAKRLGAAE